MDKTLQIQTQIRHNAEEISTALSEMGKWEKQMKNRDGNIKAAHLKAARVPRAPIRSGVGTVPVQDKGSVSTVKTTEPKKHPANDAASSLWQTPSSIVASTAPPRSSTESIAVPSARGTYEAKDLEESERERGNAEFKGGNFTAAVKCYTKCLGLKGKNYVAFSNRAMAYLKLKEYARAVSDCSCALLIEPTHVKSLLRRSTAYNAVGKHRAALRDLMAAAAIEPANKQVRQDMLTTKELLRNAVSRAPLVTLHALTANLSATNDTTGGDTGGGGSGLEVVVQGPDVRPPNFTTVVIEEEEEEVVEIAVEQVSAPEVARSEEVPENVPLPGSSSVPLGATSPLSTTRVAITIDDDSDTDKPPATAPIPTTTTVPGATNTAETMTASATTPIKATATTTASSSTKKSKKVVPVSPPTVSTASITSCYELERELEVASKDPTLIARVFERIKRTEIKGILSNLLEPTVIYRLLNAVYLHFGTRKALTCVKWYTTVAGTKKFAIQYGLLDEPYKVILRENLQAIMDYVKENEVEGLSVDRVAEVLALY